VGPEHASDAPCTLEDAMQLAQRMAAAIALPLAPGQWATLQAIVANEYRPQSTQWATLPFPSHDRLRVLGLLAATLVLVRSRNVPPRECLLLATGQRAARSLLATAQACLESELGELGWTACDGEILERPGFRLRVLPIQERTMRGLASDDVILPAECMLVQPSPFEHMLAPREMRVGDTHLTLDFD